MANPNAWLTYYPAIVAVLLVFLLAALALGIWSARRMARLERHYRALTTGANGDNLQALLEDHVQQLRDATAHVEALDQAVRSLQEDSCGHVQHLGFMRFNPFRETGGDQSFVLALADGRGNGAVISTLHSRDLTRVYAKPLSAWQSAYPLTDEEQAVIKKAQGGA